MTGTRSERRSLGVGNDAQTRPDQTRVVLALVCGVSGYESIHRYGPYGGRLTTMDGASGAFDGGR